MLTRQWISSNTLKIACASSSSSEKSWMFNLGQGAAAKWQLNVWIFVPAFHLLQGIEAVNFAVCRAAVAQNLETCLAFQQSLADTCSKILPKISSGASPKSVPCSQALQLKFTAAKCLVAGLAARTVTTRCPETGGHHNTNRLTKQWAGFQRSSG